MGIVDFVKGGVRRMMIARDDALKDQVVTKHPDQTFPFWSQLTVDSDEVTLFFRDGRYVGLLGPGRHTLQTDNIPFLNALVDRFTGGDVFISELFFVTVKPIYNQGFGGPVGSMRDPELDLRVNPRAYGTYSYRVVDPVRFVLEFVGQTGAADPERAMQWVGDQLMMGVRTTLTRMVQAGELTMMDFGTAGPDVARSIVRDCPDLARIGVQVLEIAKLNLNLSDEDQARIDEFQDQIVQAKVNARKAKIAIEQAEAEARQRQYQLDQDFANRARYLAQLDMQRYQQYAGAEAMMGMGAGMAQGGGEGAALGMAGAGMAAGLGFGAGAMQGAWAGAPAAGWRGYGPMPQGPGAGPGPGAPPAPPLPYGMQAQQPGPPPPDYGAAAVPPAAIAGAAGLVCARCRAPNPPGARFCAACGTSLV